jgi:hypothetical protein
MAGGAGSVTLTRSERPVGSRDFPHARLQGFGVAAFPASYVWVPDCGEILEHIGADHTEKHNTGERRLERDKADLRAPGAAKRRGGCRLSAATRATLPCFPR